MNEAPGVQLLKYDSSPFADLRTRDRLSISLHKSKIQWDRFRIIAVDIPIQKGKKQGGYQFWNLAGHMLAFSRLGLKAWE